MSQRRRPAGVPATLTGTLEAGAMLQRPFGSPLPDGYFPIVQSHPRKSVVIVEHNAVGVTLRNDGPRHALYLVMFVNAQTAARVQKTVEGAQAAMDLLRGLRLTPKPGSKP